MTEPTKIFLNETLNDKSQVIADFIISAGPNARSSLTETIVSTLGIKGNDAIVELETALGDSKHSIWKLVSNKIKWSHSNNSSAPLDKLLKSLDDDSKADCGSNAARSYFIVWIYVFFIEHSSPLFSILTIACLLAGLFIATFIFGPLRYAISILLCKIALKNSARNRAVVNPPSAIEYYFYHAVTFLIETTIFYQVLGYIHSIS